MEHEHRIDKLEQFAAKQDENTKHILRSIDDIKDVLSGMVDIQRTIVENDASTKSAHKRIDKIEDKMEVLCEKCPITEKVKKLEGHRDKAVGAVLLTWIAAIGALIYKN